MIARRIFAFAIAAGVAAAPAIAAKQIVVRASGPSAKSYPVGRQLPPGARVSLQPGDSLTVMGPSKAMVLQGPGSFSLALNEDAAPFNRGRFSARRGPPAPRGPWAVDIEHSGQVCAAARQPLSLWRSVAAEAAAVTITGASGQSVTLDWPADSHILAWPSQLPLDQGAAYRVQLSGRPASSEWKIASIGPWQLDRAASAETLLANGCEAQLDQLVERALWDN